MRTLCYYVWIELFVVDDNETILATKPKQSVKWIHSWVNQFGKTISPGQSESISTNLVKKNKLTFPPPTTFSAANTALPQRGQTSEPPSFCANFDGLGLLVGRWDVCLCDKYRPATLMHIGKATMQMEISY